MSLISRRDCLLFGTLASFGLGARRGQSALSSPRSVNDGTSFGAAKRCILVWLDGGPSHLETFDPKPLAPSEVRGPLGTCSTRLSGETFGEGMPHLAQRSDRFTVIRSMTSPVGEHNLATQYALSGHIPGGRAAAPAFSLPVAQTLNRQRPWPAHVAVPDFQLGGGSQLTGYLGASALPWSLNVDAGKPNLPDRILIGSDQMDSTKLERRRQLLDPQYASALRESIDLLIEPAAKQTFNLDLEPASTRARYGEKPIGQNCLLARRLLEAGVPMVTINHQGWDTHDRLHERLHVGYKGAQVPVGLIPSLDKAVAALLDDLHASGLLDETLVIVMGEFGRTPKINTQGGRDHWARAYSAMLAGAGIHRGLIYGKSDKVGESIVEYPVTPGDLVATLYHLLGTHPDELTPTPDGQQLRRVAEGSNVLHAVLT